GASQERHIARWQWWGVVVVMVSGNGGGARRVTARVFTSIARRLVTARTGVGRARGAGGGDLAAPGRAMILLQRVVRPRQQTRLRATVDLALATEHRRIVLVVDARLHQVRLGLALQTSLVGGIQVDGD